MYNLQNIKKLAEEKRITIRELADQRKVIQQLTGHKSEKMVGKYIHKPTPELMDSTMKLFPEELQ